MGFGAELKLKAGKIRANLTSLDDQPLAKAALTIIIFLDIFILGSIFNGLDAHTKQLSSPDSYIPNTCREIVVNRQWNPTNRIDNLAQIIVSASRSHYRSEERKKERHPVCTPYIDLVEQIKEDKVLVKVFEERLESQRESGELQREIDNLKGAYDTSLLETIARKEESQTKVAATKDDFLKKAAALDALKAKMTALDQSINGDGKIRLLWEKLQSLKEQERQRVLSDLRSLNFWYPVKKLGMQLIFLIPLFAIFYAWNSASIRKCRGIQTLVSSHLLAVSSIPILCNVIEAVYDIIPKKLLKQLMDLLEALKLIAVWHYLIIALAVGAALFLIYLVQKKLFSSERIARIIERRISHGDCQQCGKHLPAGSTACPFCGFVQYKQCGNCHNQMHFYGKFCQTCGHPSPD